MNFLTFSALLLSLFWGFIFAAFLQRTEVGRWLCNKRTYMTVIVGIGVDLLLLFLVIPAQYVMAAVLVIGLSSIGIIVRSIANELAEHRELEQINAAAPDKRHQRH